jgi:DNA invertase Pin-like site-specific DNA recombinase
MSGKRKRIPAVAYMRTSSITNVGQDKDSEKRQRVAISAYAKSARYEIAEEDWFYDPAIKGADQVADRPGFSAMLERIASNGVRVILIESPDRFARDLAVQLSGHAFLRSLGVELIPTTAPDFFTEDTPTAVLVRQVLGAVAQFEKSSLVAKLKTARDRKKVETGKCGGRKSVHQAYPEAVAMARRLRADRPRLSYRKISAALRDAGHVTRRGTEHSPTAIRHMLEGHTTPSGKPYSASAMQSMLG